MTRRRISPSRLFANDPIEEAIFKDSLGLAKDIDEVLERLKDFKSDQIRAILYKKPDGGLGKYAIIETVEGPLDMALIYQSLKARFGGGAYRAIVQAANRNITTLDFDIMKDAVKEKPDNDGSLMGGDFFKLMLMQQSEARQEAREYARDAAERQDRERAHQLQIWGLVAAAAVPALAPMLTGANREKMSDIVRMMNESKASGNNLKETAEMMLTFKKLFSDDKSPGFDADDVVGSIGRMAQPLLTAAGRAFQNRGGAPGGGGQVEEASPGEVGDGRLYLPPPATPSLQLLPDGAAAPAAAEPVYGPPAPAAAGAAATHPLVALIGPHVMYFFHARHDPGLAAEAIADIMDRERVTEAQVNELVATFGLSADWKADLAAQGFELRSDDNWIDDFFSDLNDIWADRHSDGQRRAGGARGLADAAPDETMGGEGLGAARDPAEGAAAH
jgi:hypothetical protein